MPFIFHQDAVPTCATSLQKMETIGPVVIEIASIEIPTVGANPPKVQLDCNIVKGDPKSNQIQKSSPAPSSFGVGTSYGDF